MYIIIGLIISVLYLTKAIKGNNSTLSIIAGCFLIVPLWPIAALAYLYGVFLAVCVLCDERRGVQPKSWYHKEARK